MGLIRFTKRMFKPVFNFKQAADGERLAEQASGIKKLAQTLFIPRRGGAPESLDEAMQRLHLTKQQVERKKQSFWRLTIIMLLVALAVLGYFIYHLINGHGPGAIVTIVVFFIALVLAFRYHFWYFQLKQGKLGCTLKEWFYQGILGRQ